MGREKSTPAWRRRKRKKTNENHQSKKHSNKASLTPIHPVDILFSLCRGLASVGSSAGDSTARGSSRALGSSSTEKSGSAMPTFSRGGEKEGGGDDENSSSASSPPPLPGLFGRPRLQSVVA